jgi:hypothetical protein
MRLITMKSSSIAQEWISYESKRNQNKHYNVHLRRARVIETSSLAHSLLLLMLVLIVVLRRQV